MHKLIERASNCKRLRGRDVRLKENVEIMEDGNETLTEQKKGI